MQYCSYSIRLYFHHQSHPQLGVVLLWLRLFVFSGVISLLFSSSTLGTYWLWSLSFSAISLCLFILSMRFSRQKYWSSLPFPLQWTNFCQNSPPWPAHLGWPYMAWFIALLSETRLSSMWSVWLVLSGCGFHSDCSLMDNDKKLMEASWWERLTEGDTGSCSDGQGYAQ